MSLGLIYNDKRHIFDKTETEPPLLIYPMFEKTGLVRHGFSTRLGGVSEGEFTSLNLSFDRGDKKEAVMENFRRIAGSLASVVRIWCSADRRIRQMCALLQKRTGGKGS